MRRLGDFRHGIYPHAEVWADGHHWGHVIAVESDRVLARHQSSKIEQWFYSASYAGETVWCGLFPLPNLQQQLFRRPIEIRNDHFQRFMARVDLREQVERGK